MAAPVMADAGFLLCACAWTALFALLLVSGPTDRRGVLALLAVGTSAAWAVAWALDAPPPGMPGDVPQRSPFADSLRLLAWSAFLVSLLPPAAAPGSGGAKGGGARPARRGPERRAANAPVLDPRSERGRSYGERRRPGALRPTGRAARFAPFALAALAVQAGVALLGPDAPAAGALRTQLLPALWLATALYALVLAESVARAADPGRRRVPGMLCLALGAMFAIDFLAFTDALLFQRHGGALWQVRGWVFAPLALPVALALMRAPERAMRARADAVAGSTALLLGGAWLLLVAAAAWLVRYAGLERIGVATVVVALSGVGTVLALVASRPLRDRARVFVSKHLFSYKYDYRREWLGFTRTLADDARTPPERIVAGLRAIVESDAGTLWVRVAEHRFEVRAMQGVTGHDGLAPAKLVALVRFMQRTGWLIDLDEYRTSPARYGGLELPAEFVSSPSAWLIVPLVALEDVVGFVLIGRSRLLKRIDWEDRDLLKTAGRQAGGLLALHLADAALAEARQFEAFNRTSAYVVHDLKNLLGQQSLIVSNAARHKRDPDFVDDMVATVDDSVARMRSLLSQLTEREAQERPSVRTHAPVALGALLREAVAARSPVRPVPALELGDVAGSAAGSVGPDSGPYVLADRERLLRIVGHLVQNAQEACRPEGRVTVSACAGDGEARVRVIDDGVGMDAGFVRDGLFRPFHSTKGLTGMGIGAFETRDYARALGGDVHVASEPGRGTTFTLTLPTVPAPRTDTEQSA